MKIASFGKLAMAFCWAASLVAAGDGGKGEVYRKIQGGVRQLLTDAGVAGKSNSTVVAVLDFDNVGDAVKAQALGEGVAEMISAQTTRLGMVKVIDRKRLQSILKELALSQSGMVDDTSAKQTGRLLAADLLLMGSVSRLGPQVSVAMRLVNVETAAQVAALTVELPAGQLLPMAQAASLEKKFPVTAAFRSLSIPGWGHFYNDEPGWGVFYIVTVAGGVGTSLYFTLAAEQAKKDYLAVNADNYTAYVKTALSPQQAAKTMGDQADAMLLVRNVSWIATGGLWVFNAIHAWIAAAAINGRIQTFTENRWGSPLPNAFALYPTRDGAGLVWARSF